MRKINRRGGASSHPHSVISARKFPTAWTRLIRSATVIGSPVMLLTAVVSEVMNPSICRRRSSCASEVKVGSAARYLPKCANLVARQLTVFGTQVACLRFKYATTAGRSAAGTSAMRC